MKTITNQVKNKKFNILPIMVVLLLGGFISLINETILNVALSKLMVEMSVTAGTIQWLATGYMLVIAISVPVTAFLIKTFTTKQLYISAMMLFLIGTISAAFSSSFTMLLISRMIQAAGTGMMIPLMTNTVFVINPPEKRGSAMGLCFLVILVAPAVGPIISGVLLQYYNWHVLFFMLIPVAVIAIIAGYLFLKNVLEITKPKIDYLSIVLSSIGFCGILYGISKISELGPNILGMIISFVIGIISLALFIKRQLSLKEPMLELRVFKSPAFSIGVILVMCAMMIIFSMNMIIPLFLQDALKASSSTAALTLLPAGIVSALVTLIAGRLYDKIGAKILVPLGFGIIGLALMFLSGSSSTTTISTIAIIYCFVCLGTALTMAPTQTNALNSLSKENYAHGIAIMNTLQQLAAAIGSSLFISIMSAYQINYLKQMSNPSGVNEQISAVVAGFNHTLVVALIFIIISFVLSLFLKGKVRPNSPISST
ncbi:MAG: MDR family MFS transporter [Minisyncoccales bacterium]